MKWIKKIGNLLSTLLIIALFAAVAAIAIPKFAGIEIRAVLTGSMTPNYNVGDMIYAVPAEFEDIQVGDAISYVLNEELTVVTHRVVEIDEANRQFYTQGDANNTRDGSPVLYDNVLGVVRFSIPYAGKVIALLDNQTYKIAAITIIAVIFIISLMIKINTKDSEEEEHMETAEAEKNLKEREEQLNAREKELEEREKALCEEQRPEKKTAVSKSSVISKGLIIFAILLAVGNTTIALLKQQTNGVVNNFSLGQVPIEIDEGGIDPDEVKWGSETKPIFLKNTGSVSAIVRVMILPILRDGSGNYLGSDIGELKAPDGSALLLGDFTFYFKESFAGGESSNWIFNSNDGYFYYKKSIEPGASSVQLLAGVDLTDPDDAEKYQDISVEIQVFADSLQSGGSAPEEWNAVVESDGRVTYSFP